MSTEKAQALVVRGTDYSETSRIVTLWTRELGKVPRPGQGRPAAALRVRVLP